jgi:hypothetical protein
VLEESFDSAFETRAEERAGAARAEAMVEAARVATAEGGRGGERAEAVKAAVG